eukprot:Gregarina_sp_Poly_1__3650@NODE_2076_length_2727_cov_13_328195_g1339_i0_p1_GENE_NODE_2076_length_2727_cov_13_328195_g1339_i0NODE_2076_length_2727_cov_13_328195_g1339_i0_p1_ORF_typecomplete_len604_score58_08_NODE_2076_length_2727_cov_13_328195_g1339_i01301941
MNIRIEMKNCQNFLRSSPRLGRGKVFDLLLGCANIITFDSAVTFSCPFLNEVDCLEDGKCKILSAVDILWATSLSAIDLSERPIQLLESGLFLNAEHEGISRIWQELVNTRLSLEKDGDRMDDRDFVKNALKNVGPLAVLVEAYNHLKLDSTQTSQLGVNWNQDFPSFLCGVASRIQFRQNLLNAPLFRLANFAFSAEKAPIISNDETHHRSSVVGSWKASGRDPGISEQPSPVTTYVKQLLLQFPGAQNALITSKDEISSDPSASDLSDTHERPTSVFRIHFLGEFSDPLNSGLELPRFTKVNKKELDEGLRHYGDANFYLRQMMFTEGLDQECLLRVIWNIRMRGTPFDCGKLIERLRWLQKKNAHLEPILARLVEYIQTRKLSVAHRENLPYHYFFRGFKFANNIEPDSSQLQSKWHDAYPRVESGRWEAYEAAEEKWPFFVAMDRSNWFAFQTFLTHGFNCIPITDLRNGEIPESTLKEMKKKGAIIVLTKDQCKKLIDGGKLDPSGRLCGFHTVWGTLEEVLLECLEAKGFEPLLANAYRCFIDGWPLLEDWITKDLCRGLCPRCKNVFSLEELNWVVARNHAVWQKRRGREISGVHS